MPKQRQQWTEANMKQAIDAINSKSMGWKLAAKTYNVPKNTLKRRVQNKNKICKDTEKGFLGGQSPVFSREIEESLVNHIKDMCDRYFGLTSTDIRRLAFQLAESLKIKHPFSQNNKMAGWQWLQDFLKRNPGLSFRIPEATSLARASAFNKIQIEKYFDSLQIILEKYKFSADCIYNMDESGFTTVQSRTERVVAQKGRKQVGTLTSAERGQRFTAVCAMNAVGNYVPPAMIFPRKYMKQELIDKAPTGTVGYAQENGWMTTEIFLKWLNHFKEQTKPSQNKKILLLLDGHSSHKNIEVLEFAKKNHILLFCFPPHCTHRLQPLDVSLFGPLTTFYNQAIRTWMLQNAGRGITHFQVGEIFNQAYSKAATVGNATSGFKKTGIHPFDPHIFPDWMLTPSKTTDVGPETTISVEARDVAATKSNQAAAAGTCNIEKDLQGNNTNNAANKLVPVNLTEKIPEKTFAHNNKTEAEQGSTSSPSCSSSVSGNTNIINLIQVLSPIPEVTKQQKRKRTQKSKHGAVNSTPNLEEAREVERQKRVAEERKAAKRAKRNLAEEDSDEVVDPFVDADDGSDAPCIYCNSLYSESRKNDFWIKCQQCKLWAHTDCADVSRKVKSFICDVCKA